MRLSERMREVLVLGTKQELRRVHDGKAGAPPWPAPWQTLHALLKRGLLDHEVRRDRKGYMMEVWSTSQAGREALVPPRKVPKDTVTSLRAKGRARSRVMIGGVWVEQSFPEPEQVNPGEWWTQRGKVKRADAQERKARARQSRAA